VDSLSCGFAMQRLGRSFSSYTFQLDSRESEDAYYSEIAAREFGWEWNLIEIPTSRIVDDFIELARVYRCRNKTEFETLYAMKYLIPATREQIVVSGITADTLWGTAKSTKIKYIRDKDGFDRSRKKKFSGNCEWVFSFRRLAERFGKDFFAPYHRENMLEFALKFHLPLTRGKTIVTGAFLEEFSRVKKRPNRNLQLVSGISDLFQGLLDTPLNFRGRKRVSDLCRDHADETERGQPRFDFQGRRNDG